VEAGVTSGRFSVSDPIVALSAMGGSLLALLELGFARPEVDAEQAAMRVLLRAACRGSRSRGR
jgi:hypothetical protein